MEVVLNTAEKFFNEDIDIDSNELKSLTFGFSFNSNVIRLPSYLTTLIFGNCFNQKLPTLPPTLLYLEFGDMFNTSIESLPVGLQTLIFGYHYNKKIDCIYKTNLLYLTLGILYNIEITYLPDSLNTLVLQGFYDKPIYIPPNLKVLKLSHVYNRMLTGCENIEEMHFNKEYQIPYFPSNLKHLAVFETGSLLDYLSITNYNGFVNLISLDISGYVNADYIPYLPDSIVNLNIYRYTEPISKFPKNLRKLIIMVYENTADNLLKNIPPLEYISIGNNNIYDEDIFDMFDLSIKYIDFKYMEFDNYGKKIKRLKNLDTLIIKYLVIESNEINFSNFPSSLCVFKLLKSNDNVYLNCFMRSKTLALPMYCYNIDIHTDKEYNTIQKNNTLELMFMYMIYNKKKLFLPSEIYSIIYNDIRGDGF